MYYDYFSNDSSMIGRYKVLERIDGGGFADVYKVQDGWGNIFALKQLREPTSENINYFRQEINALLSLRNEENIVQISDYSLMGHLYYTMEYFPLGSLKNHLGCSEDRLIDILLQVINGMSAVHRRGGFHRDPKPANILVKWNQGTGRFIYFLSDFGVARLPNLGSLMTCTPKGTPEYMAFELFNGGKVTTKSDIYSLGVTAYELLKAERSRFPSVFGASIRLNALLYRMTSSAPRERPSLEEIKCELNCILTEKQNGNPLNSSNITWGQIGLLAGGVAGFFLLVNTKSK